MTETVINTKLEFFTTWLVDYTVRARGRQYPTDDGNGELCPQVAQISKSPNTGRTIADIDAVHITYLPNADQDRGSLPMTVIRFELVPLSDDRLKVRADCYSELATQLYMELVTEIAKYWHGAFGLGLSEGASNRQAEPSEQSQPTASAALGKGQDKEESVTSTPTEECRIKLRRILDGFFSIDELRGLCFDMNIDFEELVGETKSEKAIALIEYCERRGRTLELETKVYTLRPNASLEDMPE